MMQGLLDLPFPLEVMARLLVLCHIKTWPIVMKSSFVDAFFLFNRTSGFSGEN
jgi:hypothetical protein